jgi:ankyrin repeat protein
MNFNGSWTIEQVKAELNSKPELLADRDTNGRTPLLIACFAKNWDVATYLVERGADVTTQDKFGASALIFACMMSQFEVAKVLVAKGADLSVKNTV